MQHYALYLACGHLFEVTAVASLDGKQFSPDYRGKVMPCRHPSGCPGGAVIRQERIGRLTGLSEPPKKA